MEERRSPVPARVADGQRLGYAAALGSGVVWGLDGVLLGVVLAMAPFTGGASLVAGPLAAAGLHDGFAAAWLLLFDLVTGRRRDLIPALRSRAGATVCVAALFGGPLAMSGYLLGIDLAGAAPTLAISATYPAVASLLAIVVLRERVVGRVWAGIALCVAGAVAVSYVPSAAPGPRPVLGIAFAGLAAFGWGVESVLAARAMRTIAPAVAITIRELTSFVVYFLIVIPAAGALSIVGAAFWQRSLALLALVALGGAVSYLWIYWAVNRCGVSRAMPLNVTYAFWGVVFSIILIDARPGWTVIAGALLTAAGAGLVVSRPAVPADRE